MATNVQLEKQVKEMRNELDIFKKQIIRHLGIGQKKKEDPMKELLNQPSKELKELSRQNSLVIRKNKTNFDFREGKVLIVPKDVYQIIEDLSNQLGAEVNSTATNLLSNGIQNLTIVEDQEV